MLGPDGVVVGEQAFDCVTETLKADAEGVPGFGFFRAQGAVVEFFGFFVTLEGQAFGGEAADGDQTGALFQAALEVGPVFFIELFGYVERGFGLLFFFGFERGKEMCFERVAFGG